MTMNHGRPLRRQSGPEAVPVMVLQVSLQSAGLRASAAEDARSLQETMRNMDI